MEELAKYQKVERSESHEMEELNIDPVLMRKVRGSSADAVAPLMSHLYCCAPSGSQPYLDRELRALPVRSIDCESRLNVSDLDRAPFPSHTSYPNPPRRRDLPRTVRSATRVSSP